VERSNISKKSVLFPKKLIDEHDKVAQLVKIKRDPVMDEAIKAIHPTLNSKYYYADNDYLIRPPKDFDEFVEEGTKLLHCVCTNGYYKDHVAGTRLIFFVRKRNKPDNPFYTVEYGVDSQRVIQCYGYRHANATPEIKAFTGKWSSRHAAPQKDKAAA
jgi:hypothetical protein